LQTLNYFEELKNSETGWQLCVQAVSSETHSSPEVQFFCFQVIEHFVKTRYLLSSSEHQNILKDFLCNWARMQVRSRIVLVRLFMYEILMYMNMNVSVKGSKTILIMNYFLPLVDPAKCLSS